MVRPFSGTGSQTRGPHVLVARLDSLGDMLVCGPAIRAIAARARKVTVLAGPAGAPAARLLPGVAEVLTWDCPWISPEPAPVRARDIGEVVEQVALAEVDEAVILTSFHQSALPTALVLRLARVPRVAGVSEDYPGSLLDVRVPDPPPGPEPQRMLEICASAGFSLPPADDGRLAIRSAPARRPAVVPDSPYLVAHPGASAPARAYPPVQWRRAVDALAAAGWQVVVTGSPDEKALTSFVAAGASPERVHDLGGRLNLTELAEVLRHAEAVVVANTGPAHLAAAVGTPVVSLFAPVVPAERWSPHGVPVALLGDQQSRCRDSRARTCPVEGHPCLAGVSSEDIVEAVSALASRSSETPMTLPQQLAVVGNATTRGGT